MNGHDVQKNTEKNYTEMLIMFNLSDGIIGHFTFSSCFLSKIFLNIPTILERKTEKWNKNKDITLKLPGERITIAVSRAYSS